MVALYIQRKYEVQIHQVMTLANKLHHFPPQGGLIFNLFHPGRD